jgi:hypothetical protein
MDRTSEEMFLVLCRLVEEMKEKFNKISRLLEKGAPHIPEPIRKTTIYQKIKEKNNNYLEKTLQEEYKKINEILKELKDKHKGERCFLIGTGPSLNKTNLKLLENEIIFGVNSLYKIKDIKSKYYMVTDERVWKKHKENILKLDNYLFLGRYAARDFISNKKRYNDNLRNGIILPVRYSKNLIEKKTFPRYISNGLYDGDSVTISAIQIIHHLGFSKVYLLGCDCDYSGTHHFDGSKADNAKTNGMASGNYKNIFDEYRICKKEFEKDGRKIYNATVGGKLEVFERKRLEDLL